MTKIGLIAATSLFMSVCAISAAPSAADEIATEVTAQQVASNACLSFNQYAPSQAVRAVTDGLGDWIVWVRDKDNDLWLCNASSEGNVFANVLIRGDLLHGKGEQALTLMSVAHSLAHDDGAKKVERLCAVGGRRVGATQIVTTVEDGTGDYVVWLKADDQSYWLCNASAKGELYVFAPVGSALNTSPVDPANRSA